MGLNHDLIYDFKLFPNPTHDFINLNIKLENFKVEIFNVLGEKLFESDNLNIIDVKGYDKGTYLLKVSSGYNFNSKLFIKK